MQVQGYMSSLLQAAAPAPTDPQVNGASLIHADVNPAGAMCTYTARKSRQSQVETGAIVNMVLQNVLALAAMVSKTTRQAQ